MVNLQPATDKPTCMAYKPHLGYYIAETNHLHPVRELTDEELAKNEQFMPIYKEAANRLKLFKVFESKLRCLGQVYQLLAQFRT